jgi:hypothetical protein
MKRTLKTHCVLFSVALVLAMAGCSTTPKVHTQAKPGTDYARYHTFALLPLSATGPASDPGLMLRVAEPARQAANEALTARGLTQADPAQADIVVNLRGSSLPKVDVTDWGYSRTAYTRAGRVPVHVGRVDVRTYEERTLTVEIFDQRSKELVWVGWSKREASGPIKTEKLQEAIRNILSTFPPPSTTK